MEDEPDIEAPETGDLDDRGPIESRRALERLIFFSDAVFAIAMTLLVLDIPKPGPHDALHGFFQNNRGTFLGSSSASGSSRCTGSDITGCSGLCSATTRA